MPVLGFSSDARRPFRESQKSIASGVCSCWTLVTMMYARRIRSVALTAVALQFAGCGDGETVVGPAGLPVAPVAVVPAGAAAGQVAVAPATVEGQATQPAEAVVPPVVAQPAVPVAPTPATVVPPAAEVPVEPVVVEDPTPALPEPVVVEDPAPALPEPAPVEPAIVPEPADLCEAGDCNGFVAGMDGYFYNVPCEPGGNGCSETPCQGGHFELTEDFVVGGLPEETYRVSFRTRGVVEAQNYRGGERRIGDTRMDTDWTGADLWYEGGEAPIDSYATYALHVEPASAGAPEVYYLNARDGSNAHDSTTWAIAYDATLDVRGGSTIRFRTYDNNCRSTLACGKGTTCESPELDLSEVTPARENPAQPFNDNGKSPQWLHFDVTNVEKL